ncbi:hypothetical protein [Streptomyces sp. NPDC086777]|uniref:hypothetical protein n=1 Tax=Streptomyces sp. NPDC086777 TaxID=3154866 RepID=UPI00344DE771
MRVHQFKEIGFRSPVRTGEEFDALHDPAGYAPPAIAARGTGKRAFPYFTVVCLPLLIVATNVFVSGL